MPVNNKREFICKTSNCSISSRPAAALRRFSAEPVSDDMLDTIMEAGRWAPSGNNNQPWRFVRGARP